MLVKQLATPNCRVDSFLIVFLVTEDLLFIYSFVDRLY